MSSTLKRVTKSGTTVIFPLFLLNRCRLVGTCHDWLHSQKKPWYSVIESFLLFPPQAKFQSLTIAETRGSLVTNGWTGACLRQSNRKGSVGQGNSSTTSKIKGQVVKINVSTTNDKVGERCKRMLFSLSYVFSSESWHLWPINQLGVDAVFAAWSKVIWTI